MKRIFLVSGVIAAVAAYAASAEAQVTESQTKVDQHLNGVEVKHKTKTDYGDVTVKRSNKTFYGDNGTVVKQRKTKVKDNYPDQ